MKDPFLKTVELLLERRVTVRATICCVRWRCRVSGEERLSTIVVEYSVGPGSVEAPEFSSLEERVREVASGREWTAEELASTIAEMLSRWRPRVVLWSKESDTMSVEVEAR